MEQKYKLKALWWLKLVFFPPTCFTKKPHLTGVPSPLNDLFEGHHLSTDANNINA